IARCEALFADADRAAEAGLRLALASLLAMRGDFRHAEEELYASIAISDEFGYSGAASRDDAMARAEIVWLRGDTVAAESVLREARTSLEEDGDAAWLATISARLAELLAETGGRDEAIQLAGRAEQLVVRGDVRTEAAWRRARALAGDTEGEGLAREAIEM